MNDFYRKLVHMLSGLFALLLPFIGGPWASMLALAAFLLNVFLLPRLAPSIYRGDQESGAVGIILYPLSVLIVIVIFGRADLLYIAAGAWAFLAFGDGASTMIGRRFGTQKLPWNPDKSWAGLAAFVIAGWIGSLVFMGWYDFWMESVQLALPYLLLGTLLVAIACAVIESTRLPVNDNIAVALCSAALLWLLSLNLSGAELGETVSWWRIFFGILINLAIAGLTLVRGMVAPSGALAGFLVGAIIYIFGGPGAFVILLVFFFLATFATKHKYEQKHKLGVAQEKGGKRGAKHALANCGTGVVLALWMAATEGGLYFDPFTLAFVAAFATALSDTLSSELGQAYGKTPVLITNLRPARVGAEGAISFEGTIAGVLGSVLIAFLGWLFFHTPSDELLYGQDFPFAAIPVVILAAFVGTTVESYLGATVEKIKNLDNELMNFINTVVGAVAAVVLAYLMIGS